MDVILHAHPVCDESHIQLQHSLLPLIAYYHKEQGCGVKGKMSNSYFTNFSDLSKISNPDSFLTKRE